MTMRALLLVGLLAVPLTAQTPPPPPSALSELDQLKATNLKLRAQVLELQRLLAQAELTAGQAALERERATLEAAFRLALAPPAAHVFSWQTLTFGPPPPAPPAPGPQP